MLDLNVYWMEEKFDEKNLIYCVNKFNPIKFYVGLVGGGMGRKTLIEESLENKILTIGSNPDYFLFKCNDKELFHFERDHKKGFDIRYDLRNFNGAFETISKLVNVNYKKSQYMEIHFRGKIEVEKSKKERAKGLPFYKIKKS